jgi:glycosyltransferase involved in cell wall biosynthesis
MTETNVSIVIPTRNRAEKLTGCLEKLKEQDFQNFEVVIVDDGSSDNTKEIVNSFPGLEIQYLYQEHIQQGAARNKGIKIARGKYIVFIGDDIYPETRWLSEHMKFHEQNKGIAVLGLTLWPKEWEINEFMRYLAPNGPQFNYGLIKDANNCGWDFFLTSNISLERIWFEHDVFDENFRGWGYEDLELGYRLEKKGLRIVFNDKAVAYHHHYYNSPEPFLKMQENAAISAVYFAKKFPALKSVLIDKNKLKPLYRTLLFIFNVLPWLKKINKLRIIYWKLKRRHYFENGLM